MSTIKTLVSSYAKNTNEGFNEGLYFKNNKNQKFILDKSLELIPIKIVDTDTKPKVRFVDFVDKVKNATSEFFGHSRFNKEIIKSALLKKAEEEGTLQVLTGSKLWEDLTQPIYSGL